MFNNVKVVFLAAILSALHIQVWAQGFYSTYNTPYQNSFAFATPNLKQIFTTKLATGSQIQPFTQQLQDQQAYNLPQQSYNLPQQSYNVPQQNLQFNNLPPNFFSTQNNGAYSTAPQQFPVQNNELRQQLAYYQQQQIQSQQQQAQQQQQQQQQYLEQFQAHDSRQRDLDFDRQSNPQAKEEVRNLLGVAYSPSTQVSQVKFDSGKLKYDF